MKIWKVARVPDMYLDKRLEEKLNELQRSGCEIKTVYPVIRNGDGNWIDIVYTEEDKEMLL